MMIFKKSMQRRTFLQGAGAMIALPYLDAMVPALAAAKDQPQAVRRFSIVYTPNGRNMDHWIPTTTGRSFELSSSMQPLAGYRDQMLVISGLDNPEGNALPGEGESAPHERAGGCFLTCEHPERKGKVGISIDQVIANEIGKNTQLPSLELGLHNKDVMGNCEKGWSCAYMDTISWRDATTPLPVEYRPRAVFERMFGDSSSTDPEVRMDRMRKEKSILDSVTEASSRMLREVSAEDRRTLSQYLDGIRELEHRIQIAERQTSREIPSMERPTGVPSEFEDHLKLMFDLQVLAFQTDMTRMITFMTGPEQSNRTYKQIGIPDVHHSLSHHQGDPAKLKKYARIDKYHSELMTYYLDKLRSTPDVDGTLFDNIMVMFGSAISDGNEHSLANLPIMLLGGGTGELQGGRHLKFPGGTRISNLYVTLADKLGVKLDKFGDSTGKLNLEA